MLRMRRRAATKVMVTIIPLDKRPSTLSDSNGSGPNRDWVSRKSFYLKRLVKKKVE